MRGLTILGAVASVCGGAAASPTAALSVPAAWDVPAPRGALRLRGRLLFYAQPPLLRAAPFADVVVARGSPLASSAPALATELAEQDAVLDALSVSVSRLGALSEAVHGEIAAQDALLAAWRNGELA